MATVKELREQAKAAGIKRYSRMRKTELESALSIQTTTEKTSEKAEHLLRASYWEQKALVNEEYSLYDIVRLLAEYGVMNSLYEYECKQYFFRTGKKAKADFILKQVLLDWLHERAEGHEKVSEPISAERTEESKAALKNLTAEDDFNGVSVKMIHNNECIENTSTESELEDLLNTADEYTLRYILHRKGYETEKAESECTKAELVKAYVKEEMQLRWEAKALDELGHSGRLYNELCKGKSTGGKRNERRQT